MARSRQVFTVLLILAYIPLAAFVLLLWSTGYLGELVRGQTVVQSVPSPDGRYVAYVREQPCIDPPNQGLLVERADRTRFPLIAKLVADVDSIKEIIWAPDSQIVVFLSRCYLTAARVSDWQTVRIYLGKEWVRSRPVRQATFCGAQPIRKVSAVKFPAPDRVAYRMEGDDEWYTIQLSSDARKPTPLSHRTFTKDEAIRAPTLYDVVHKAGLSTASVIWPCSNGAKSLDWIIYLLNENRLAELTAILTKKLGAVEGVLSVMGPSEFTELGVPQPDDNPEAPHLVLTTGPGYQFAKEVTGPVIADAGGAKGSHGHDPRADYMHAMFVAVGAGIQPGVQLDVVRSIDVAPSIAHLLGVPMPTTQGRVIEQAVSAISSSAIPADPSSTSLFDGKSFQGWEGNLTAFRIEEGAIVGGNRTKPIPRNDYLCSKKTYADFELRLKFKVLGEGANAGIQIRSERVPNSNEMIGYQADLGDNWWGCLYDERRHKLLTGPPEEQRGEIIRRDGWNQYVIRCQGRRIQLWINGRQTVDYIEPDESIPQAGVIGLQIHAGPPSEAWYKDIELVKLPPAH